MKSRICRLAVVAAASVVAAAAVVASATADPVQVAAGTGIETSSVPSSVIQHGSNVFIEGTATGALTGTLSGTIVEHFSFLSQADGHIIYEAKGTFTGTVGDCGLVTVDYVNIFHGTLAAYSGHFTTTGEHGGPRFQAGFTGGGPVLSYTGTYHC